MNEQIPRIKKDRFCIRIESNRLTKLRKVAGTKRKTMTALVEEWIDTLPKE